MLTEWLIAKATEQQFHAPISGIDTSNTASITLYEKLSFTHVVTMPQVGFKFGRWLDLAFCQLVLPARSADASSAGGWLTLPRSRRFARKTLPAATAAATKRRRLSPPSETPAPA